MKKAKELDDNGRKKQATVLTIVRVAVLVVAVTLIVVGIFNGSMRDVLIKAAKSPPNRHQMSAGTDWKAGT